VRRSLAGIVGAPLLVLVLLGLGAAVARADVGVQITINEQPGPFIDQAEMQGASPDLVAELAGVAPADNLTSMQVSDGDDDIGCCLMLNQDEVVSGFGSPPAPAVFSVATLENPPSTYFQEPDGGPQLNSGQGGDGLPLYVDLEVSGSVLGVPTPTAPAGSVTLGDPVQFSELGPVTSNVLDPNAPADPNTLMYSWDFGDGTTPTTPSPSPSVSHTFAAAGTYDVRVTVTDSANNAGVSAQAAVVQVAKLAQTISFPQLGPFTDGQAPVVLTASASSGLPVMYSRVSGPCALSDITLTLTGPGSCVVDADQAGSDTYAAAPTVTSTITIAAVAPADTALPVVSGSAQVGQTLSCSTGTWSGSAPQTYSYQWLRDGGAIPGATNSTYAVQSADQGHSIACIVTSTNGGGSASATSPGVPIAAAPPPPTIAPASVGPPGISGSASIGHTLSCATGAWSGTAPLSYTYQWKRDGLPLAGATKATYLVAAADGGHSLTCGVTATNPAGTANAQSAAITVKLASNAFTLGKLRAAKNGSVAFKLTAPGAGSVVAVATFTTSNERSAKKANYGRTSVVVTKAGTKTVTIDPTKRVAALIAKGKLRVTVSVTFSPTGGKPRTELETTTIGRRAP
jgi:PKD repeat protein